MLTGMTVPKPKLRWSLFRRRSLLLFVTVFAVVCSWVAERLRQVEREKTAERVISKMGAFVQRNVGSFDIAPRTSPLPTSAHFHDKWRVFCCWYKVGD
jgi:hypothetical protein